ncbi:MAG: hypothetical protein WAU21_04480 [Chitinophagales bacterium]|nr:hypothetical protein [Bacteroidota bacterium]MBK8488154.1 hypothetical protein [Bacteroidota bacterium]MBP7540809.1 hypothetical protein [Saprospiraceae bacterium]MBP9189617.1 hypothetical protein [Chitinophagales bacterium]
MKIFYTFLIIIFLGCTQYSRIIPEITNLEIIKIDRNKYDCMECLIKINLQVYNGTSMDLLYCKMPLSNICTRTPKSDDFTLVLDTAKIPPFAWDFHFKDARELPLFYYDLVDTCRVCNDSINIFWKSSSKNNIDLYLSTLAFCSDTNVMREFYQYLADSDFYIRFNNPIDNKIIYARKSDNFLYNIIQAQ